MLHVFFTPALLFYMSVVEFATFSLPKTTDGKREWAVALRQESLSLREIASRLKKSTSFVKGALSKNAQGCRLKPECI